MSENDAPEVTMNANELLQLHPLPWSHHLLLIKDANGKQVVHTGGLYNEFGRLYEGRYLSGLNALIVTSINARADLAAPDAGESEKQFHFWLNNHWPDWKKSENQQNVVELMWDAWSAALRLARFDTLAHKGALDYIIELEKSQALTYRMARHIRNTDEVPINRWGVDGMDLLAELRDLNPEQYDAEVKGPVPVAAAPDAAQTCVWSLDDLMDGDLWETSCGQAFQFNDGGPEDNHFKFCYCCGRPLEALRRTEGDEVDDLRAEGEENK